MDLEEGSQSLLEENRKLSEELAQCKADKEFVWLLWKQLQKQSPDLTSTVDMVVTREKLKNEQRNREMVSSLETKDKEIASLRRQISRMKEDLREKQHLVEEHARKEQQIEALQEELCALGNKMSKLSAECSCSLGQCKDMDKQLKSKEQQLLRVKEANKSKDSEIKQLRGELREVSNSRDAWANHTTLQTSTIQKLQAKSGQLQATMAGKDEQLRSLSESVQQLTSQLDELKEQKCHFEREYNRLLGSREEVSCRPQETDGSEALRLNELLEKTERELFEARTQLEAKSEELQSLRCSHDWRLQRMRTLQSSYKLVLEQLKTYENKRPCMSVEEWSGYETIISHEGTVYFHEDFLTATDA